MNGKADSGQLLLIFSVIDSYTLASWALGADKGITSRASNRLTKRATTPELMDQVLGDLGIPVSQHPANNRDFLARARIRCHRQFGRQPFA